MQSHNEWLKCADDDLVVAKIILRSDEIRIPPILYHCQQAGEKALKAYLVFKKQVPERTHDLTKLLEHCMEFDKEFSTLLVESSELTQFAFKTRYPDSAFAIPSISMAECAIKQAQKIVEFVQNKVD